MTRRCPRLRHGSIHVHERRVEAKNCVLCNGSTWLEFATTASLYRPRANEDYLWNPLCASCRSSPEGRRFLHERICLYAYDGIETVFDICVVCEDNCPEWHDCVAGQAVCSEECRRAAQDRLDRDYAPVSGAHLATWTA